MDKSDVIIFFDNLASSWDDSQVRNEEVIRIILDKGGIKKDADVLDVACGTGVLFEDYLERGVASVIGIDISSEMVRISSNKFPQVKVICGDAENYSFRSHFDAIMIYNAFPHFPDPDSLLKNLAEALKVGGRISVAHGLNEVQLEKCHSTAARNVSFPLPSKEKLAEMMSAYVDVDVMISDDQMYMVSGIKS